VRAALDAGRQGQPDVPVAACFYGPDLARDGEADLEGRVPVYDAIDAAARALGRTADYAQWRDSDEGTCLHLAEADALRARTVIQGAVAAGRSPLGREALEEVLRAAGLTRTPTRDVRTVDEAAEAAAEVGYPVVLKAVDRPATAKTVADGFALDLVDERGLRSAWARMVDHAGADEFPAVVQPFVPSGVVDVAVTVTDNPEVGPIMALGPGGASAALDPAVDLRVLPVSDLDAVRLIDSCRVAPLLDGHTRAHLEDVIVRISALVEAVPEITGLRANPIIVTPTGATLTDVWIDVAPRDVVPLPPLRRVGED